MLCAASALVVSLLSVEVFLRYHPELYSYGYRTSNNPRLIYELQPGHPVEHSYINSSGLHDFNYNVRKSPEVYRVAVVGDSISFGYGVRLKYAFPKVLERLLNEGGSRVFEVINFSVPGYNSVQQAEWIQQKILAYSPNLIVLSFCANDTHLPNFIHPAPNLINVVFHRSYLLHYLLWRFDNFWRRHPFSPKKYTAFKRDILEMAYPEERIYPTPGLEVSMLVEHNPPGDEKLVPSRYRRMIGIDAYRVALSTIVKVAKQHGVQLLSTGFFNKGDVFHKIQILSGIEFIFPFSLQKFASNHRQSMGDFLMPDGGHLSPLGHDVVAHRLVDPIRSISTKMMENPLKRRKYPE
jgi:lysophospholipase L1-like esterase